MKKKKRDACIIKECGRGPEQNERSEKKKKILKKMSGDGAVYQDWQCTLWSV